MTADDVTKLFDVFIAEYEKFEFSKDKVILWATMLADVPYDVVKVAAMTLIAKSPYPPKLADITAKIADVTTPKSEKITGAEAWGEVQRAIRKFGRYKEKETLDCLSPLTRKVTEMFGLNDLLNADTDVIGVTKGQFIKMFDAYKGRIKEDKAVIPFAMQDTIRQLSERFGTGFLQIKEGDDEE